MPNAINYKKCKLKLHSDTVVCTYNFRTWEVEAGGYQAQGQPGLHLEVLPQNQKQKPGKSNIHTKFYNAVLYFTYTRVAIVHKTDSKHMLVKPGKLTIIILWWCKCKTCIQFGK